MSEQQKARCLDSITALRDCGYTCLTTAIQHHLKVETPPEPVMLFQMERVQTFAASLLTGRSRRTCWSCVHHVCTCVCV